MAGCWDEYRHRGFNTLCARASSLNTSLHFNEFDMIFEEMSVSLVEYLSARCGAINCDESHLFGWVVMSSQVKAWTTCKPMQVRAHTKLLIHAMRLLLIKLVNYSRR